MQELIDAQETLIGQQQALIGDLQTLVGQQQALSNDQEALLNAYRCMFNVDTQVVPGGCDGQDAGQSEPGQQEDSQKVAADAALLCPNWIAELEATQAIKSAWTDSAKALEVGDVTRANDLFQQAINTIRISYAGRLQTLIPVLQSERLIGLFTAMNNSLLKLSNTLESESSDQELADAIFAAVDQLEEIEAVLNPLCAGTEGGDLAALGEARVCAAWRDGAELNQSLVQDWRALAEALESGDSTRDDFFFTAPGAVFRNFYADTLRSIIPAISSEELVGRVNQVIGSMGKLSDIIVANGPDDELAAAMRATLNALDELDMGLAELCS